MFFLINFTIYLSFLSLLLILFLQNVFLELVSQMESWGYQIAFMKCMMIYDA